MLVRKSSNSREKIVKQMNTCVGVGRMTSGFSSPKTAAAGVLVDCEAPTAGSRVLLRIDVSNIIGSASREGASGVSTLCCFFFFLAPPLLEGESRFFLLWP